MMFYYDKMLDRDFAARTVGVISRRNCGYALLSDPLTRVRCDCKYGIADHPDEDMHQSHSSHSEQTGCPELMMIEEIIKGIPKREWERLVKKALKMNRKQTKAKKKKKKVTVNGH